MVVAQPARFGPQIYEYLKGQLLQGAFASGEKLSINDIRAEFGTSRQPVLDAMRMLETDGLVEILPQVGCIVKTYTADDIADYFTLFASIEGLVAQMAADRRSDEQLAELRDIMAAGSPASDPDATEQYRKMNSRFHRKIHDMADSSIINETCGRHWDLADFMINTMGGLPQVAETLDTRMGDHSGIFAAIEAGDGAGAAAAAAGHVNFAARAIMAAFTERV